MKIRILVEGDITDAMPVKYASRARLRSSCWRSGVEIYEYQPTMMHAKAMMVDGTWSMFGSANFDNRSLELNDEMNVAVIDRALSARRCLARFRTGPDPREELNLEEWRRRPHLEKTREQFWSLLRRSVLTLPGGERSPCLSSNRCSVTQRPPRVIASFAPSPTGYLHVGGARTALFNWLYARRHGGTFVLRIEDTDAERSSWEMVTGIVDGLRWLGLDWDEGRTSAGRTRPYFQSRAHSTAIARWRSGSSRRAAPTTATARPDSLKEKRGHGEAAGRHGSTTAPAARCRRTRSPRGRPPRPRARSASRCPRGRTAFDDLVHGPIEFDNANIEDFVILRSDGQPTYHLSVVADDIDMANQRMSSAATITSPTRRSRCCCIEALGAAPPEFAHVPLILGPDKKRLSKRHGATSVMEYPRLGYLPEAMVNFLALLGWSPGQRPGAVHPRRADRARSRSKASAAATPSSTPRSWTGSTSSTSRGSTWPSWLVASEPRPARGGLCGPTS